MPELFSDIPAETVTPEAPAVPPADEIAPYGFIAVSSGKASLTYSKVWALTSFSPEDRR